MVYCFARIGTALGMTIKDVFTQNRRLWVWLREKGRPAACLPAAGCPTFFDPRN
jgi:hypothetical protein